MLEILPSDIIPGVRTGAGGAWTRQLFYCRRAESVSGCGGDARRAFLEAVLGRVPDEKLREELNAQLESKLEQS